MVACRRTLDFVAPPLEIASLRRQHAKVMGMSDTRHHLFPTSNQGFDFDEKYYWMTRVQDSRHLRRTRSMHVIVLRPHW